VTAQGYESSGINRPSRLFILAVFGLHLAFMPLLVLLLPRRTETLFGSGATASLSMLLFIGAVTASIANIAAGHLGDQWIKRHGNRRGLIGIGFVILVFSFGLLAFAHRWETLAFAIVAFQIGLNLTMAPMMALLADHIAGFQKGMIAGWLGTALPLSALGTTALGWAFPTDNDAAFFACAAMAAICVLPLLVLWGFKPVEQSQSSLDSGSASEPTGPIQNLALLWLARALVQISASFVLLYLFLHVAGLIADDAAWQSQSATHFVSVLSLIAAAMAVPTAVMSGRLSDRLPSREKIMAGAALMLALSLFLMGRRPDPWIYGLAFAVFQMGLAAYLSVDTALVAQLVGRHARRGAILGIMNLTNTLPAILVPALTLQMLSATHYALPLATIYMCCALGLLMSAIAVLATRARLT
jgi:MFS family permease